MRFCLRQMPSKCDQWEPGSNWSTFEAGVGRIMRQFTTACCKWANSYSSSNTYWLALQLIGRSERRMPAQKNSDELHSLKSSQPACNTPKTRHQRRWSTTSKSKKGRFAQRMGQLKVSWGPVNSRFYFLQLAIELLDLEFNQIAIFPVKYFGSCVCSNGFI